MLRKSEKFNRILSHVCDVTGETKQDILSSSKLIDVCMARNLLFLSCKRIGMRPITIQQLCKKQGWTSVGHSTVLKNITKAKDLEEKNEEFKSVLHEIIQSI
jgi:chromosomal replication initiation ATPase DnaA